MKKTLRKLTLSRETLRALNDAGLTQAGAGPGQVVPFTYNQCTGDTCECTWGCTRELCSVIC